MHFALVALRGVEQQEGVAGGCGVEHDDPLACRVDRARERAEHGDLLGAWRAQVFFEQRAALLVEADRGREHLFGVAGRFDCGVDALHQQAVWRGIGQRVGDVSGGVGRGEGDVVAAVDQRDRDRGRERRLADSAFAHRHDDAVAGGVQLVDQLLQARKVSGRDIRPVRERCAARAGELPQSVQSGDIAGDELDPCSG